MLEHHFVQALLVREGLKLQLVHAVKQYESLKAFTEPRPAAGRQALYISRLTIDLAFRGEHSYLMLCLWIEKP